MPTSLFILSRFTLRVDDVLFRTHDTRLYHSFTSKSPLMVRDISGWEAPYEHVQRVSTFATPMSLIFICVIASPKT
jgi:type 2A phosphatase activator TIP41